MSLRVWKNGKRLWDGTMRGKTIAIQSKRTFNCPCQCFMMIALALWSPWWQKLQPLSSGITIIYENWLIWTSRQGGLPLSGNPSAQLDVCKYRNNHQPGITHLKCKYMSGRACYNITALQDSKWTLNFMEITSMQWDGWRMAVWRLSWIWDERNRQIWLD